MKKRNRRLAILFTVFSTLMLATRCLNEGEYIQMYKAKALRFFRSVAQNSSVTHGIASAPTPAFGSQNQPVPAINTLRVFSNATGTSSWYKGKTSITKTKELSFNVSGVVKAVYVRGGSFVAPEKLLISLDSAYMEEKLKALEISLSKARIETLRKKREFENAYKRKQEGKAPDQEVIEAWKKFVVADTEERNYRKQLQNTLRQFYGHYLKAREKGKIVSVSVKAGDQVEKGQSVMTFAPTYPVTVTVSVPAVFITQIGESDRASVRFKDINGTFSAFVMDIGPMTYGADSQSIVTLIVNRSSASLSEGMEASATFKFEFGLKGTSFVVPSELVMKDDKGYFVYIVKPSDDFGVIEKRYITIGLAGGFGQEILSGLSDGELLATTNLKYLNNGVRVKWR
mgnify:CR=1 FL=1